MNEDALDLLAALRAVGLTLTPDGDWLWVRPRSKLTDPRRQAIQDHKLALLAALKAERLTSETIARVARRAVGSPSPLRQAATPGPKTDLLDCSKHRANPGDTTS